MNAKDDELETFGANYSIAPLHEAPQMPTANFNPPEGLPSAHETVSLAITPLGGNAWGARFTGIDLGLQGCYHTPDVNSLLVVCGFTYYWVDAVTQTVAVTETFLVRSVHEAPSRGLLLLAGDAELCALNRTGELVWQVKGLATYGFEEVRVTSDFVAVRGYTIEENRKLETMIALSNGEVVSQG